MVAIVSYLAKHPCVDCGETDPLVLQFDHVAGVKTINVTATLHLADWGKIAAEIAKCAVRCANCHSRKTSSQLGWLRAVVAQQVEHLPSKQAQTGFESPLPLSQGAAPDRFAGPRPGRCG